ncbi:MAG: hypothetical protein R3F26_09910 [Gammaproteobacteria bacterium]|nr:hypothetical protein [Pseudomonadales bacterium]MCP5331691.1 hypothetical protein [Pseudomonadales bacterium]
MTTSSLQGMPMKRGAAKYLALIFALVLLVFQSSTLVHSHNGDLNKHLDCTFCLHLGSGHDALPTTAPILTIPPLRHEYAAVFAAPVVFARVPANSRAPPLYS